MYKIIVMNLGSTSTKLAYYEDDQCRIRETLDHPAQALSGYKTVVDQYEYRFGVLNTFLLENGVDYKDVDAIVSRGGHTRPLTGGAYRINDLMLAEVKSGRFGRHVADVGVMIAHAMGQDGRAVPMVVDPPVTDEFEPLARYSGLPEMPRRSSFHALNHRACAKHHAKTLGLDYNKLNLVVVHMGGGITVAAHKAGKMVDANNGIEGGGPFSTNRTGDLPVGALTEMCFSGKYTLQEVKKKLNGAGGMMAYIGQTDLRTVLAEIERGNTAYKECLDAMLYQTAKEIGADATVLKGKVDGILLTGGMAYADYVVDFIREYAGYIAPVYAYPGEYEMQALALGAYGALRGDEPLKVMED